MKMYCIPGHATQVLKVNTTTNVSTLIGPVMKGKYKWLRGVLVGETIYGLPCHADTVLKVHVPTGEITQLPIDYEGFFTNSSANEETSNDALSPEGKAQQQRKQEWKYHGGSVCPMDGCIYTIPQSATYVLKIDPATDECTLFGDTEIPGRYKWYGGVVGKQDGAIYGIPHSSPSVLRIHPTEGVTLHGNYIGGHKWHGATAAPDGTIVCVPANADSVLCIVPASPEPKLIEIGDVTVLKSGRHRNDTKYKFLGAMAGPDQKVYCFPCASERVIAIDTSTLTVAEIGPNIYDKNLERLCQNKWQNGVFIPKHNCILAIPLAAESVLKIDFNSNTTEPTVSTWKLPLPYRGLSKWEGAVVASGVVYTVPNNHKAVLRIDFSSDDAATKTVADQQEVQPKTKNQRGTSTCDRHVSMRVCERVNI